MKKPSFSLSTKVLFAFAVMLLPILLVFIVTYRSNKSYVEGLLTEDLRMLADARGASALLFLELNKGRIEDFSSDGHIRDQLDGIISGRGRDNGAALSDYLARHKLPLDKKISRLSVMDLKGRVAASTVKARAGLDESKEEFFMKARDAGSLAVSEYQNAGVHELVFSAPLRSRRTGRMTGVIASFVSISEMNKVFTGEQGGELGDITRDRLKGRGMMDVYLVNKNRFMITKPRLAMKLKVETPPVRACLEEKKEITGFYRDYRGIEVGGASMCIASLEWTLVVEVDKGEMLAPVYSLRRYAVITAGITGILLAGLYFFFSRVVIRQLSSLASVAKRIAEGDYGVDMPAMSSDEIGTLVASFNTMARGIRERIEAQARLTSILDATPDFVATADTRGNVLYCNKAARGMLGIGEDEDISKIRIPDAHPEWAGRLVLEEGLPVASRDGSWSGETEFLSRAGKVTPVSQVIIAHKDMDGAVIYFSTVARDITERKRAEDEVRRLNLGLETRVKERTAELEAVNRELEAFSYSVAHDLRAPLRTIDGFSQAVMDDHQGLGAEALDHLKRVCAASRRMAALIDDMLELSRVTRAEMRFTDVDLSAMARSIASELVKNEPQRGADVTIHDGLAAHGDSRLLRIVLENLIGNAWKFTARRPGAVIEFGTLGEKDGKKVFFVRDNGAGFEMKYVERLFNPFQRLHAERDFPGTGIGLATVERIIRRHGGKVWASGAVDKGATVYFII